MLRYVIKRICGQIATKAHINVARIRTISIAAKILFLRPNCNGVKAKLKTKFITNGKATAHGSFRMSALKNTTPKVTNIIVYRTAQTGPKIQLGGAHDGLISDEYHIYVLLDIQ